MLPNRNRLDAVLRAGQREALARRPAPIGYRGAWQASEPRSASTTPVRKEKAGADANEIENLKKELEYNKRRLEEEKKKKAPVVKVDNRIYANDEAAERIDQAEKKAAEAERALRELKGEPPAPAEQLRQVVYKQNRAPAAYSAAAETVDEVTKKLERLEAQRSMKIEELEKLVLKDESIKESESGLSWLLSFNSPLAKNAKARAKAIENMKTAIKQLDKDIKVAKRQLNELKAV